MTNPIDDFLGEYGEKRAFNWGKARAGAAEVGKEVGTHGGNMLVGGLMAGAGTAIAGAGALAVNHIYNAVTAKRDFKGMMEWNQDLAHEDQRLVNQSFRTLRQFAPDISRDPLVAGSMIRQMVQAPQGAAGIMQQALQGQKNVGSPVMDAYMTAAGKSMGEGAKGVSVFGNTGIDRLKETHEKELSERQKQKDNQLLEHAQAMGSMQSRLEQARRGRQDPRAEQHAYGQAVAGAGGMPLHPVQHAPVHHGPVSINYMGVPDKHVGAGERMAQAALLDPSNMIGGGSGSTKRKKGHR